MLSRIPRRRIALIDQITRAARRLRGAPPAALLRDYFRGVGEEDLAARDPRTLAMLAITHHELARRRRPGETLVKVFSPESDDPIGDRHSYALIVTDDRPFLVDSISLAFSSASVGVQMLIHPVLQTSRRSDGLLQRATLANGTSASGRESWQLYEIDRQFGDSRLERIAESLRATLQDVRVAVEDWRAMRAKVLGVLVSLQSPTSDRQRETAAMRAARSETIELLRWVEGAHFIFLGYRYHALRRVALIDCYR